MKITQVYFINGIIFISIKHKDRKYEYTSIKANHSMIIIYKNWSELKEHIFKLWAREYIHKYHYTPFSDGLSWSSTSWYRSESEQSPIYDFIWLACTIIFFWLWPIISNSFHHCRHKAFLHCRHSALTRIVLGFEKGLDC